MLVSVLQKAKSKPSIRIAMIDNDDGGPTAVVWGPPRALGHDSQREGDTGQRTYSGQLYLSMGFAWTCSLKMLLLSAASSSH